MPNHHPDEVPEFDYIPDLPTEPYWKNEPGICMYFGATGKALGYISLGQGSASHLWFGYINACDAAIIDEGELDREEAKLLMVKTLEAKWNELVANEMARNKKGRRQ